MTIFLVLALYLVFIQALVSEVKKMKKSFLAGLGFVLILVFRSPFCGMDVTGSSWTIMPESYAGVFLRISSFSIWEVLTDPQSVQGHMEVGWLLLTKIISLFTSNVQVFVAVIAILHIIPVSYIIGKYSKNVVLSYFVFAGLGFYIHYFSGIRQMLAVSVILLAFDQLYQKRMIWFVLIVLLASTIHRSSLFFIIIWPLSRIRLSFLTSLLTIIVLIVLMPLYDSLVSVLISLFFGEGYKNYIDNNAGGALTMFVVYALFLLSSFVRKTNDPLLQLLQVLVLVGVASQSLGVLSGGAITRIGFYFNIFLIFLLPEVLLSVEVSSRKIISSIAVILLCAFFVMTTTPVSSSGVIPYEFFWNNPAK